MYHALELAATVLPPHAVFAEASPTAQEQYARKKPPKGRPWPRERYVKEMKRIRPAKVLVTGPDFVGTTAALQHLPSLGYPVLHRTHEDPRSRQFDPALFEGLVAAWKEACATEGTIVTDASPWAYYHKYLLRIAPEARATHSATLATLHLPDLHLVLLTSGRETGRRGAALAGVTVDDGACVALTHMRELLLMPGDLVTIDVTTASAETTGARIDAAIRRKLFKVLPCHVQATELVSVAPEHRPLL